MSVNICIDTDTLMYRVGFANPPPTEASHACSRLATSIDKVVHDVTVSYGIVGDYIVTLFITSNFGKGRYRDQFNKETEYKANRGKGASPVFMPEMRQWLLENYNVCDAPSHLYEADDQLSWLGWYNYNRGTASNVIICGVDKDLNQIPGYHWDYGTRIPYYLDEDDSNEFFFKQLLMGDTADGIPGLKGIGPRRAEDALRNGSNPEKWWDIVLDMYTKKMPEKSPEELSDIIYERGNKLWIQRYEGQTWYPPIPEIIPF